MRLSFILLVCSVLFSGVSENYLQHNYAAQKSPKLDRIATFLKSVPPPTIIKTNEFFATHVSHRPYLYIPDDGGFWLKEIAASPSREKLAVMASGFGSGANETNFNYLKNHGYEMVIAEEGFYVMRQQVGKDNDTVSRVSGK